ncbi:MAG: hypothetical protein IT293_05350 [Deltaproteobacteria bacterium]|nr:hypothetical protein [Deltaproteobacteria bacterium]
MVKATYALDAASVRTLEKMARRWAVSKSEALRRVIKVAGAALLANDQQRLANLEHAQRALRLTPGRAEAWIREIREARQAPRPARQKKPRS